MNEIQLFQKLHLGTNTAMYRYIHLIIAQGLIVIIPE